jgi:hypothetical protein
VFAIENKPFTEEIDERIQGVVATWGAEAVWENVWRVELCRFYRLSPVHVRFQWHKCPFLTTIKPISISES